MKINYKKIISLCLVLAIFVSAMSVSGFATNAASRNGRNGDLVVMLDPGHGGNDPGGTGNGLEEKDLNLKIAQYCKEELEKYSGVKVYMTRYGDNNTATDKKQALINRAEEAKNKGADVLIALHVNDSESGGTGVEVFYPNASYRPEFNRIGEGLAQKLQNGLVGLGLHNRGIKSKDSSASPENVYQDGSRHDYYGIIRYSKEREVPALLVEHGFINNANDVNNFLNSDDKLKRLGVTDATSIADYYGLTKGTPSQSKLETYVNSFAGKLKIKATGFGANAQVGVWSHDDGQDDLKWYSLNVGENDIEIDIKNHKNSRGLYAIRVYSGDQCLASEDVMIARIPLSRATTEDTNGNETVYKATAEILSNPSEVSGVRFAVWSDPKQSDIVWYDGTKEANGVWTVKVDINNHKTEGYYYVHAYASLPNFDPEFIGSAEIIVTQPKTNELTINNYNKDAGTFDIIVDGIVAPAGVASVRVPVWCSPDQSDIVWYYATKQSNGSYKVTVNRANHNYATGLYTIHMYLYANNGLVTTKTGSQNVEQPQIEISVQDTNGKETNYELKAKDEGKLGGIHSVRFAVWSDKGGQDDLVWYDGVKANGAWTATASISNHRTEGYYYVHTYAILENGKEQFIGSTDITVTQPKTNELTINNYNKDAGTFDIIVDGIVTLAGVSRVRIPVWCSPDQSDIVWYEATKQNDGRYKVNVNIANHKYSIGLYTIHMYLDSNNGVGTTRTGSQEVELPNVGITAQDTNGKETTYGIKANNTGAFGNLQSVRFAVWGDKIGQDKSLVWYEGTRGANGEWTATANISNHGIDGYYYVHTYAILENGKEQFIGSTDFTVTQPKTNELTINNYNIEAGTFDITVDGIVALAGVSRVRIPVWCSPDQSDIVWYDATKQNDGSYKATVNIANHKYSIGLYTIHMYLYANNGVVATKAGSQEVQLPDVGITAQDTNGKGTTYELKATNAGKLGNIQSVSFAVWSDKVGQEKSLVWYDGVKGANGEWTATANISNHKMEGYYYVHVYATIEGKQSEFIGDTSFTVGEISANASVVNFNAGTGLFDIVVSDIISVSGVSQIKIPVWTRDDHSDIVWYAAEKQDDGTYIVKVDPMNHKNNSGLYVGHVYMTAGNGIEKLVTAVYQEVTTSGDFYTIMGGTTASVEQMVKYFGQSGKSYPSEALAKGGAPDIETFARIYIEEANAEGVRGEVAFAQAMKETGWLQFGNIVKVEQFNFAGIGALDGNAQGNCASFPDVRTGIRAQIQHLKAYGSKDALVNQCVDPRFHLVKREGSLYVEWLGIEENPNGAGWATGKNYGFDIVKMIKALKAL